MIDAQLVSNTWPPMTFTPPLNEDDCWKRVARRDEHGAPFVYAVTTTGIYCRPSCPSRRPLRCNVEFYPSCERAETAGYRACKRCRPRQPSVHERNLAAVVSACRLIERAETPLDLAELAESVGMSRYHFHRVFKTVTGVTPKAYSDAQRRERTSQALQRGATVTEAIYEAGFASSGRFYAQSKDMLGMDPQDFRRGGTGAEIRFAVGECSLGSILVAATRRGVCCVLLGDQPEGLVEDFQDRFRQAHLVGGDAEFESWVSQVIRLVETPRTPIDLPLDLIGTSFQQRVWNALRRIPPGSTVSYSELAKKLKMPQGARAIAQACASNPVAVAVPCHRVVRRDGSLSGYRWGVERKQELLRREQL